ncbi:hypothetical protein ACRE_048690 [Hapsidospora chrysogenum ATCC 11550]|uniref:Uncharacterized protein n=1 Tax=Hapsidospora chrysogenum (strain ATCC 11550 / CBS 779.69 / DSM 880 / IAM 14645 / JCM 23072 / IMI 49137) TaxID=857340 RepID=A0A086T4Q1_HAPC1|nr:hypothetical protein ACRE_048690 [Hapsidospora chrysogenum ATCC 11550]
MSPQPAHQAPFGAAGFAPQHFPPQSAFRPPTAPSPSTAAFFRAPTISGRKRSRDEAASNLEPDLPAPQPKESEEEWVYGPGMVLIKPNKGYVADASSQSGTWLEEKKAADEENRRRQERDMVIPRSHKSQRRGVSLVGAPLAANAPSSPPVSKTSPADNAPVIDDFTLHLGIGWRKIGDDEHIQAAARGWARYIENHYPITNVHIRLESNGLQSYLVEASEGFFLFADNLRNGRLVSTDVEGALRNLQNSPPVFDGAETLVAADSPSPVASRPEMHPVDAEMNLD